MTDAGPAGASALHLEALTVGPIETNASLVGDPATHDAVLVDPGAEAERLLARVRPPRRHPPRAVLAPPAAVVWPGHGPGATIGKEASANPFGAP